MSRATITGPESSAEKARPSAPGPPDGKRRRPRSPWPLRLALAYLVLVCGVGLLARVVAERLWWTTLLLYLPQAGYLAPAVILLPLAVRKRDGRALLVTAVALLMVAWPLMGFNVPPTAIRARPKPGTRVVKRPRVRVLEYNIHGGTDGFAGISRQIQRFQPDVVIFSEAEGWGREHKLRKELAAQFPGWNSVQGNDVYVASRWPMLAQNTEPLGAYPGWKAPARRQKVHALVQAPFGQFHVVGVHFFTALHGETLLNQRRRLPRYLRHTASARREQARDVLQYIRGMDGPVILAGDFNTPPAGEFYDKVTSPLRDAFMGAGWGWGFTYPSKLPLLRIDYVFHTPHWKAVACRVGDRPGSDHRPLFAELELAE